MDKNKLAVFDLDGTLFDTEELNYRSYAAACEKINVHIRKEKFLEVYAGKNYKQFLPEFGIVSESELKYVHEEKKILYFDYIDKARKNQSLFNLIDAIKEKYCIALATTASRDCAEKILDYFKVRDVFDFLITQEDACKLKPDPECYIKAMSIAAVIPENTIIFEDSDIGVAAGIASGAIVYRVCGF